MISGHQRIVLRGGYIGICPCGVRRVGKRKKWICQRIAGLRGRVSSIGILIRRQVALGNQLSQYFIPAKHSAGAPVFYYILIGIRHILLPGFYLVDLRNIIWRIGGNRSGHGEFGWTCK
jgi:hypothetical protein